MPLHVEQPGWSRRRPWRGQGAGAVAQLWLAIPALPVRLIQPCVGDWRGAALPWWLAWRSPPALVGKAAAHRQR